MANNSHIFKEIKGFERVPENNRRTYRKPLLEKLDDLRTLTLGGSPGTGDSGGQNPVRDPRTGLAPLLPPDDPYLP